MTNKSIQRTKQDPVAIASQGRVTSQIDFQDSSDKSRVTGTDEDVPRTEGTNEDVPRIKNTYRE